MRVLSFAPFAGLADPAVNFIVENWHLFLVAFTSGALLLWPVLRKGGSGSIGTAEAVRLINREKGVLIDVGEPAEFAGGHATGARNVPIGRIEGAKELPSNKAIPVILLCPTGARASRAAALLRKEGWAAAVSVAGGTAAWREAQLPLEKSAS
jgi:rhodanese-related sulfurtransferase